MSQRSTSIGPDRPACPLDAAQREQARRLIDLLSTNPGVSSSADRLVQLVREGRDENDPEVIALAREVREHLERLRWGCA